MCGKTSNFKGIFVIFGIISEFITKVMFLSFVSAHNNAFHDLLVVHTSQVQIFSEKKLSIKTNNILRDLILPGSLTKNLKIFPGYPPEKFNIL